MTLCSHSSPDKVSLLEMKHLCVIQLINSAVRSCGCSLREPVILRCRKGTYQSTVSELFYHTSATDFIIQGNGLRAVPSAQRPQPNGAECPVKWDAVWTDGIPFNVPCKFRGRFGTAHRPFPTDSTNRRPFNVPPNKTNKNGIDAKNPPWGTRRIFCITGAYFTVFSRHFWLPVAVNWLRRVTEPSSLRTNQSMSESRGRRPPRAWISRTSLAMA